MRSVSKKSYGKNQIVKGKVGKGQWKDQAVIMNPLSTDETECKEDGHVILVGMQ